MKAKRRSAGAEGHYLKWLLAILVIAILLALLVPGVSAGWWRSEVKITNGGNALTNYPVLVKLTNHAHIDSDGDSIRFTNMANSTKYDYWIEEWDTSGTSRIWVEVPSVPAGTSNMYLWSNSSGASRESNGDATFTFFDDFPGSSLDTTKWPKQEGNPVVSDGTVKLSNDIDVIKSPIEFSIPYAVKARSKASSYDSAFVLTFDSYDNWYNGLYISIDDNSREPGSMEIETDVMEGSNLYREIHDRGIRWSEYATYEIIRVSTDEAEFYQADAHLYTETNPARIFDATGFVGFNVWDDNCERTLTADWIFVRKYASPDPGTSVGPAVDAGGGAPVPELPSVILFSVGFIVLAGYVLLRRREKKKGK